MRTLFLTPLALAGLTAAVAPFSFLSRKSLSFGPVHPNATFSTTPLSVGALFRNADPLVVARLALSQLVPKDTDWAIRDDSYTDRLTGITHVYVRQFVNGIEVANGDVNMNIKDGVVLSHGDSFYRGPTPAPFWDPGAGLNQYDKYCKQLLRTSSFVNHQRAAQMLRLGELPWNNERFNLRLHLLLANCRFRDTDMVDPKYDGGSSATKAIMRFMFSATPNAKVEKDILGRYDELLEGITSAFETHLVGDKPILIEMLHGVPGTVNPVKAKLAYVQVPVRAETVLSLVWKLEVEMQDNWYEAAVSVSEPHRIVEVLDWASDAGRKPPVPTYNVFPWGVNDRAEGNRTLYQEIPDTLASPAGWHALPASLDPSKAGKPFAEGEWHNTTTTWGNNVFAHENWEGRNNWKENYRPDGGEDLVFDFKYMQRKRQGSSTVYRKTKAPADAFAEPKKNVNASISQLFVTANLAHDLFYRYGFDEVSGNFQQYNFGRGGREDDAIIASAQDSSGYNSATFMTPPDGQKGRCKMYLWKTARPYRDSDFDTGIIIHELAHGLTTRLTGGSLNSGCLGWGESGGMGEGWGDFLASTIRSTANYSDYPMGAWAKNQEEGLRKYPYSINMTTNPTTYETLNDPDYVGMHAIGEIWAEILWVVSQKLIAAHGFSDTLFPPTPDADGVYPPNDFYKPGTLAPKRGNTLSVALVITGMKLQPCRPSFFDARDAIIQADQVLTSGENFCTLWKGFAERGLGPNAGFTGGTPWGGGAHTNDFAIPPTCKEKIPETPGKSEQFVLSRVV